MTCPPPLKTIADILAPRRDPARPHHVYQVVDGEYAVRAFPDGETFPDFWWSFRGRILHATILPGTFAGLHVVVTYFQFNAHRDEVFETVHLDGADLHVLARSGTTPAAGDAHRDACAQLQVQLPLSADPDPLPSWL